MLVARGSSRAQENEDFCLPQLLQSITKEYSAGEGHIDLRLPCLRQDRMEPLLLGALQEAVGHLFPFALSKATC